MKQFQFEQTPDILLLPSILNRFCGVRSLLGCLLGSYSPQFLHCSA
jgi:hypothetical protein